MSASKSRFNLGDMSAEEVDLEIPAGPMVARPASAPASPREGQGSELPPQAAAPVEIRTTRPRGSSTKPLVLDPTRPQMEEGMRFTNQAHDEKAIVDLATTNFVPAEIRVKTSMSLPESLNKLLDAKVYELKTRGFKKMTRESVMEDALKMYFGVK